MNNLIRDSHDRCAKLYSSGCMPAQAIEVAASMTVESQLKAHSLEERRRARTELAALIPASARLEREPFQKLICGSYDDFVAKLAGASREAVRQLGRTLDSLRSAITSGGSIESTGVPIEVKSREQYLEQLKLRALAELEYARDRGVKEVEVPVSLRHQRQNETRSLAKFDEDTRETAEALKQWLESPPHNFRDVRLTVSSVALPTQMVGMQLGVAFQR